MTANVFITPSLKAKFLSAKPISPFVSVGGGWAHYGGNNLGTTFTGVTTRDFNSGALQFGGGLDFRLPVPYLALRAEIRDVWTNSRFELFKSISVVDNRPHNIFLDGGIVFRQ